MPDRRWSDADRELVAKALGNVKLFRLTNATWSTPEIAAERVLDALTAAGWEARCDCDGVVHDLPILRSHIRGEPGCAVARAHRTTPPTDRTEES